MRGRANRAFAIPVPVRGQGCNGALIPSTAAEMSVSASLPRTGGTGVTVFKAEGLGVLLDTDERPLPEGRID